MQEQQDLQVCVSLTVVRLVPLALLYVKRIAQGQIVPNFAPGSEKYVFGIALMVAQKQTSGMYLSYKNRRMFCTKAMDRDACP